MAWRELLCRFRTLRMLFIIVACFTFIRISKVLSSAGRPQLDQELTSGDLGPQKDILPHNHRDFASIRRRHKKFPNPMQLVKDLHPIMAVQQTDVSLHKAEGWKATEQPTKITFYDNTIVHFDLKGAAPKVAYLKEVFKWVKQNGATGILIEWEDTFPFTGMLEENRCTESYTLDEVRDLLGSAQKLELDIIPLVQTFGHLEWILKLDKFRKYRQSDEHPQVVCLADESGIALVKEAIKQVVDVHKEFGVKFFHIGADEAFEYGVCEKDVAFISRHNSGGLERLVLEHLVKIAKYVRSLLSNTTRVLAWYDVLKTCSSEMLHDYEVGNHIEPVVWDYSETLQQQNEYSWRAMAASFRNIWGSSAYKGANNPSAQLLDIQHYVRNNKAWLNHKLQFGGFFENFRGLILTGWQRYDHFAVLCELLPVGFPSLIANLQIAAGGQQLDESAVERKVSLALRCSSNVSLQDSSTFILCSFPGSEAFDAINRDLKTHKDMIKHQVFENHQVRGWLGRFNTRHNYTQLWYLNDLYGLIQESYFNMLNVEKSIREALEPIYQNSTIDEWLYEYVDPVLERLVRYLDDIDRLKKERAFPRRNFKILRNIRAIRRQ